jgi:phosphomethylpyrimidine synthase
MMKQFHEDTNARISAPSGEAAVIGTRKVYVAGSRPDIRVPMKEVVQRLGDAETCEDGLLKIHLYAAVSG